MAGRLSHLHRVAFRRPVATDRLAGGLRARIAKSTRRLESTVLAKIESSGVFGEIHRDAIGRITKRKDALGVGGRPYGDDRARQIEEFMKLEGVKLFGELISSDIDDWEIDFSVVLDEEYVKAYNLGGRGAQAALRIRPNFDLRAPGVAKALTERANLLAGPVADSVFDRMLTIVAEEFYVDGQGPREVAKALESEFDFLSRQRAESIARTETLSVTEEAQQTLYLASGVPAKRWGATLSDDRTRFAHANAHGQVRPIDEPFDFEEQDGTTYQLMYPGDEAGPPEGVINCRCYLPGTLIRGIVELASRLEYVGPAIEITTRAGRRLAVTPNHPVLTDKGFAAAGSLRKGDNLVCYRAGGKSGADRPPLTDEDHAPAAVEQIFSSLAARAAVVRIHRSPLDFHGDAGFGKGKIDVVGADEMLRLGIEASALEGILQHSLIPRVERPDSGSLLLERMCQAEPGDTSNERQLEDGFTSLVGGDRGLNVELGQFGESEAANIEPASSGHASLSKYTHDHLGRDAVRSRDGFAALAGSVSGNDKVGLDVRDLDHVHGVATTTADRDAARFKDGSQRGRADAGSPGKRAISGASEVALDEVIDLRWGQFGGHVYDLQSPHGWVIAGGIITHNCFHQPIVHEDQLLEPAAIWDGATDPEDFAGLRQTASLHKVGTFVEEQHPRDVIGRFAETDEPTASPAPVLERTTRVLNESLLEFELVDSRENGTELTYDQAHDRLTALATRARAEADLARTRTRRVGRALADVKGRAPAGGR